MAEIAGGVRLHYFDSGTGVPVVLLHGFPQTAHEWRAVTPRLVDGGLRVIAPDYRGAGWSSKPPSGYDKQTMAADIHTLVRTRLKIANRIAIVGHDIGALVAIAYALEHRDDVSHVVVIDAPIPGTEAFDRMRGDPRGWHAAFHSARDIAELLVQGRERAYLRHMIEVRIFNPSAITPEDFDLYVRAYEAPGAMRAAFELYRAFDADAQAVRASLSEHGPLEIPVLSICGEHSGLGAVMPDMMREIAKHVEPLIAPRSAHWVPEENPDFVSDAILRFTRAD